MEIEFIVSIVKFYYAGDWGQNCGYKTFEVEVKAVLSFYAEKH